MGLFLTLTRKTRRKLQKTNILTFLIILNLFLIVKNTFYSSNYNKNAVIEKQPTENCDKFKLFYEKTNIRNQQTNITEIKDFYEYLLQNLNIVDIHQNNSCQKIKSFKNEWFLCDDIISTNEQLIIYSSSLNEKYNFELELLNSYLNSQVFIFDTNSNDQEEDITENLHFFPFGIIGVNKHKNTANANGKTLPKAMCIFIYLTFSNFKS